jgi:hypothetical protein
MLRCARKGMRVGKKQPLGDTGVPQHLSQFCQQLFRGEEVKLAAADL